jgi:hypothetical protein
LSSSLTLPAYTVFQSLGGALVVSAAQSIFQNELLNSLITKAPNINPISIFDIGASKIQTTFAKDDLPGIDASYMKGLHMAFTLAISMACAATLVAATQNWFRLKTPEDGDVIELGNKSEMKKKEKEG